MERFHPVCDARSRVSRNITIRAERLARSSSVPGMDAEDIKQETLLIWGRDDRMLPYEGAHFAFRHLPNAELHVFSKCGHWAMIEQRAAFNRIVLEYFGRED